MQQLGKHTLLKWLYFLRRTLEIAASVKKITLLCCAGVWEYYERGNFRPRQGRSSVTRRLLPRRCSEGIPLLIPKKRPCV